MAEVPEHLLQRSQERRKALGLPVEGDDDEATRPRPPPTDAAEDAEAEAAAEAPAAARPTPATRSPKTSAACPRTCSSGRASARPRSPATAAATAVPRRRPPRPPPVAARRRAARGRDGSRARAGRHRSRRSHATAADGRQVRFDPADARRSAGQGAHVAAPAVDRVRGVAVDDRARHDLLRAGEGAAARARRREPDAEPVEGAVVLPRAAGAAHDVPPDGRRRDHPRRRDRAARDHAVLRQEPVEQARPTASSRSR